MDVMLLAEEGAGGGALGILTTMYPAVIIGYRYYFDMS
jgi:hypothetical protein